MIEPTGYTALDLIGFTDRGAYDPTANYVKNDIVTVGNTKWRCKVDDTTGVTPAENANWTIYLESATSLAGMDDTDIVSPKNGDLIQFNSTSNKWENSDDVWATMAQNGAHNYLERGITGNDNNVTWNIREDNTIVVSGTPTGYSGVTFYAHNLPKGQYVLSGAKDCVNIVWQNIVLTSNSTTVATISINSKDDYTFDTSQYTYDTAKVELKRDENGTTCSGTVYPMIRLASDHNTDYTPYAPTNRDLAYVLPTIKNNGAYNLYKIGVSSQSSSGVTYSISKGVVTVNTNGTLGSEVNFEMNLSGDRTPLPAGTYKLVGCPVVSGQENKWQLKYIYDISGSYTAAQDFGNGAIFTLTGSETTAWMRITLGAGANGTYTFKPMITTDLNATYDDYVEYAKTNRELTEDIKPVYFDVNNIASNNGTVDIGVMKCGSVYQLKITINNANSWATGSGDRITFTLPSSIPAPTMNSAGIGLNVVTAQVGSNRSVLLQNNSGGSISANNGQSVSVTYIAK